MTTPFDAELREKLVESSDELCKSLEPVLEFVDKQAILQLHTESMEIKSSILTAPNHETANHYRQELKHKEKTLDSAINEGHFKKDWEEIYKRGATIKYVRDLLIEAAKKLAPIIKDLAVKNGKELLGG